VKTLVFDILAMSLAALNNPARSCSFVVTSPDPMGVSGSSRNCSFQQRAHSEGPEIDRKMGDGL
jgi:hypothetical protein